MEKQIERKACKNCIHYQLCVHLFREAKQKYPALPFEEGAFFADASDCDFYADKRIYRKQEWISVEERLPNEYTRVIGCVTEKVSIPVSGECYRVGNRFHFPTLGYNRPISYWMPLPEPPKGVAE